MVAIALAGTVYLRTIRLHRARAAELEQRSREAEAQVAEAQQKSQTLENQLRQSDSAAAAHANEAARLRQQLATAAPSTHEHATPNPGAQMLKDPQMKAMMKKQQGENIARLTDKLLDADFVQRLGLNAEQTTYLKELVKKKYAPGGDLTIELMAGELGDSQMAELGKQFKQQMAETDAQIKSFLGDDAYKTFEWQEKSQDERERLGKFQAKLTNQGQPLTPEQHDGLLRAMYEERQGFQFKVDYGDPLNYDYEHLHEFFSPDNFERYFQDMEELNVKIAQRAEAFLTPEQTAQFKAVQQDQLEKGKVTVRLTNALFGNRKN